MIKTQFGLDIVEWMFNKGGEFDSNRLNTFLKSKGIKVCCSAPYTPQQNGHTEWFNQTIMDKAEAIQHETCISES